MLGDRRTMEPLDVALKALLRERGMTQTDLWTATGLTKSAVSRYVNGTRGRVGDQRTMAPMEAFAKALDVEPEYFVEYRLCQICRVLWSTPEISEQIYDLVMQAARFVREGEPHGAERE